MATLVNVVGGTRLATADKYRLTHRFTFGSVIPGALLDAVGYARQLRDAYPSAGCYAVSLVEARDGDKVVVFDVRLTAAGVAQYSTVAPWVDALNRIDGVALTIDRVEKLASAGQPGADDSGQLAADREMARAAGNQANTVAAPILQPLGDALDKLGGILTSVPLWVGIGLAVALVAVTRAKGARVF